MVTKADIERGIEVRRSYDVRRRAQKKYKAYCEVKKAVSQMASGGEYYYVSPWLWGMIYKKCRLITMGEGNIMTVFTESFRLQLIDYSYAFISLRMDK